jgi:hypothetical protein
MSESQPPPPEPQQPPEPEVPEPDPAKKVSSAMGTVWLIAGMAGIALLLALSLFIAGM